MLIEFTADAMEVGEIILRENLYAKKYFKDPESTEKLFAGGWMHTGDLAVWHPDGAIQILDRVKDIIISGELNPVGYKLNITFILTISGGENISSVSVDSILMKHPDIVEADMIGVPDERWGRNPHGIHYHDAWVRSKGSRCVSWARESSDMGRFMVPREVQIVQELPKTSTGNMQKNALQ